MKNSGQEKADFLVHCRTILQSVTGSEKAAHILSGEIAVFYYAFFSKQAKVDGITQFSIYKTNGILLILGCFLGIFIIETVAMHFLIGLWNVTAAWVLTGLSAYSCIQLFGHMKAIKARSIVLSADSIMLRNGVMGGDATIPLTLIQKIEYQKKQIAGADVAKIAMIKGLENHNLAIYLKEPVVVTKAFGITKKARVILINIDQAEAFLQRVQPLITPSA